MAAAIRVVNLSKHYRVGATRQHDTLRDLIVDRARKPFGRRPGSATREPFWALRDVSLEIAPGEIVGIVGRNGAGKSTLLKILSRVTVPTEGRAEIRGMVGSLLEVGTGFHPELSGRENIFLNGAILGMPRSQIRRKFDEIVAFSEVERFIDTPVKRYSSGMYVRLAFAVAAYLEPDVLVVDEVLAVGDAAFQKKCLGHMDAVAHQGRTVVFVSHNVGVVNQLCSRAIILEGGRVFADGPTREITQRYLDLIMPKEAGREFRAEPPSNADFALTRVAITDAGGESVGSIPLWEPTWVELEVVVRRELRGSNLAFSIARDGFTVFNSFDVDLSPELLERREPGHWHVRIPLPMDLLPAGTYTVSATTGFMTFEGEVDTREHATAFEITADAEFLAHKSWAPHRTAAILSRLPWSFKRVDG